MFPSRDPSEQSSLGMTVLTGFHAFCNPAQLLAARRAQNAQFFLMRSPVSFGTFMNKRYDRRALLS
jgi:hypothetical protein